VEVIRLRASIEGGGAAAADDQTVDLGVFIRPAGDGTRADDGDIVRMVS